MIKSSYFNCFVIACCENKLAIAGKVHATNSSRMSRKRCRFSLSEIVKKTKYNIISTSNKNNCEIITLQVSIIERFYL